MTSGKGATERQSGFGVYSKSRISAGRIPGWITPLDTPDGRGTIDEIIQRASTGLKVCRADSIQRIGCPIQQHANLCRRFTVPLLEDDMRCEMLLRRGTPLTRGVRRTGGRILFIPVERQIKLILLYLNKIGSMNSLCEAQTWHSKGNRYVMAVFNVCFISGRTCHAEDFL